LYGRVHREAQPARAPGAEPGHRIGAACRGRDPVGDLADHAVENGVEERLLALEVVVQRAALDPGGRQDRLDGGAVVAVPAEQLAARRDQPLAGGPALLDPEILHRRAL
jgi:hypothetical protein